MTFKKFLRKINRGVVLFIVLLIGFIIFVTAQTIGFRREKTAIKELCNEYCKAVCEMSITPSDSYKQTETLSDSQNAAIANKIDDFAKFWAVTDTIDNIDYYTNVSEMKTAVKSALEENYKANAFISDMICKIDDDSYYITRVADDLAHVTFDCEYTVNHANGVEVPVSFDSLQTYYGFDQPEFVLNDHGDYVDVESGAVLTQAEYDKVLAELPEYKTKTYIYSYGDLYLRKTADGWKIIYAEPSVSYSSNMKG